MFSVCVGVIAVKNIVKWFVRCLVSILMICVLMPASNGMAYALLVASNDTPASLDTKKTDIAQIFITTSNSINKDDYVSATISIVDEKNGSFNTIIDDQAKIKVRGNSTANLHKQPFNFKLSKSEGVLGMPKGKKWCLLANHLDPSLMRNALAYQFAENIGLPYSCQTRYVDVWLNGKYNGNYLLTVPVEVGTNRVDINTEDNEYLIEIQKSKIEEGVTYLCSQIYRFEIGEPEIITEEQKQYLYHLLVNAEKAMKSGNVKEIKKYIDFDTFIDFYIVQELFKNKDFNVSSTRFYIKNDKIYAGPVWDFDLSCGNVSKYPLYKDFLAYNNYGEYGSGSGNSYEGFWTVSSLDKTQASWIELLMGCNEFSFAFYARYLELQDQIVHLYQDNALGTNQMDVLRKKYGNAFNRDVSLWPLSILRNSELYRTEEKTFGDSVVFLRSFLKNRNEWLLTALTKYESPKPADSAGAGLAMPTAAKVLVNGVEISFEAYSINGNNYFKLRDLAKVLSGSSKQFEVAWDNEKGAINLESNKPYTVVGGELRKSDGLKKQYSQLTAFIYKDGKRIAPTAHTINGNNYFKLRDIGALFNFGVTWDATSGTISIDTNASYVP